MTLNEDLAILDPADAAQNAYDESARPRFQASCLHPWTIARHSVAMTLGCRLISAVGPFVPEFLADGNYSNILRDVVIVLWLSSLDEKRIIEVDRADVSESMDKAYKWAEERGIEYGSPAYLEGVALLDRILKQILASFFEVEQTVGELKKKAIKPLGKSRLLLRLQKPAVKPRLLSFIECLWRKLCNGKRSTSKPSGNYDFRED
jgi:hypothetical protein